MTRVPALGVAACALAATACGGGTVEVPRDRPTEADVRQVAAHAGRAVYYLGPSFAGFPLTGAVAGPDGATFVYGTCEIELPAHGGCAPPVQVQNFRFRAHDWRRAEGCYVLPPVRGLPAARHDGLVLFTRDGIVKIYARGRAEQERAARALLPAAGRGELRPATGRVLRVISDHCAGAAPQP